MIPHFCMDTIESNRICDFLEGLGNKKALPSKPKSNIKEIYKMEPHG